MGHSLIERYFSSFASCLRRLLAEHPNSWHNLAGRVSCIYNRTSHRALGGSSPNEVHFNLPKHSLYPDIFRCLDEANTGTVYSRNQQEMNSKAYSIVRSKMEKYNRDQDSQWRKKHPKMSQDHPFQPGTLVLVKKFGKKQKLSNVNYWWGPATVLKLPSRETVDLQYLVNGAIARRHVSH